MDAVTATTVGIGVASRHFALALSLLLAFAWRVFGNAADTNVVTRIAALIAPAKLARLRPGAANARLQKAVCHLAEARRTGGSVAEVAAQAVRLAGYTNREAAKLTADALIRNHETATKLGCITPSGLAEMRRGKSPTVAVGPYKGQELSVDHIIPKAVAPELDRVMANLELLPLSLNQRKSDLVGERQISLARKLREAGLLSTAGLDRILRAAKP